MIRKHANRSIDDLELLVRSTATVAGDLLEVRYELTHRSTRRARQLLVALDSRLARTGQHAGTRPVVASSRPIGFTASLPSQSKLATTSANRPPVVPSPRGTLPAPPSTREIGNSLRSSAGRPQIQMRRCSVCGSPAIPGDSLCFTHCC
jgi:hypothetical protein